MEHFARKARQSAQGKQLAIELPQTDGSGRRPTRLGDARTAGSLTTGVKVQAHERSKRVDTQMTNQTIPEAGWCHSLWRHGSCPDQAPSAWASLDMDLCGSRFSDRFRCEPRTLPAEKDKKS